jgi:hypothetical protein
LFPVRKVANLDKTGTTPFRSTPRFQHTISTIESALGQVEPGVVRWLVEVVGEGPEKK